MLHSTLDGVRSLPRLHSYVNECKITLSNNVLTYIIVLRLYSCKLSIIPILLSPIDSLHPVPFELS